MYDFIFKPFNEMTESDYSTVGFMSGLEIHQQLYTEKKLFCRCPAGQYSEVYDAEILRHMRPTLSELGEYDGTALMEFKTKKEIIYRIKRETVCTYEMDDTPPFELNDHALDVALGIAMLYRCFMVDELHIARKQYLDGSIPTGFQRTTIVGVDGKIPYRNREIRIFQLGLEEDACREVSDIGHQRVYLTDRLGMPLIETVTAPDMRTPYEVAEVGQILRRIVRSTGMVRTGIGAARQDVNVSVTGGTRVEIKGVPRIPNIPLLTYNEAMRQWNLLRLREELARRGITPETFWSRTEQVTKLLKKTRFHPIASALNSGMVAYAVILQGYKGLLRWQTQTDTFFSREISDRVRVIACLTTLPNIVHSDSPSETLSTSDWKAIRKATGTTEDDTVVVVWGDKQDSETGAKEIAIRAKEATIGIPSETRQALSDGTNGFERILPGPDRMYPDTDLPPKKVTPERLESIRIALPQPVWLREAWYQTLGIPQDVIKPLAMSPFADLFETVTKEWQFNPSLASVALVQWRKRLKRKGLNVSLLTVEIMKSIFQLFHKKHIAKEGISLLMERTCKRGTLAVEDIPSPCPDTEFSLIVDSSHQLIHSLSLRHEEKEEEVRMGYVMNKLRGRIDGAVVAERVGFRKEVQQ
ncbi:MAG: Glu-tRNA(Gln) amidotransferase subunit GatE [bacterium]